MSRRRILPIALVLALSLSAVATTGSAAAAPSSGDQPAVVTSSDDSRIGVRARSAVVGPFLRAVFSHLVYRARPIVATYVKQRVRQYAWDWTKRQLAWWACGRWDAYFGYDRSSWYWAANYYPYPSWAWNLCVRYGYFG